jgi:diguanylate cyclase (GGDEF)-like protein/PAS domain S-box-containing protein
VIAEARRQQRGAESGAWFRALFCDSPTGLVVIDLAGAVRLANDALLSLTGQAAAPATRAVWTYVVPDQQVAVEQFFWRAYAGEPIEFDTILTCADGSTVPVGATFFPLRRGGTIAAIGARVRDLSSARLSEQWLLETEQRFRSLFDYHSDAVALVDRTGAVVLANAAVSKISGFPLEELALRPLEMIYAPDEHATLARALANTFKGETAEFESIIVDRDGAYKEALIKTVPVFVNGEAGGAYVLAKDISAQKSAEREAAEQTERVRSLYLVAASAGRSTGEQIQATLELGCRLLGCTTAVLNEIEGDELVIRYLSGGIRRGVGSRRKIQHSFLRHCLTTRDVLAIDDIRQPPWSADPAQADGGRWNAIIGTAIEVFGKTFGTIVFTSRGKRQRLFREVDQDLVRLMGALCGSALERLAHENRLGALAFYDALTGLPNRVLFDDRVAQTFMAARRHHQRFALLYLDLDHFKEVNDIHGHPGGDELLRVVAHRLLAIARESDTVARQGGDEFVILQRFVRSSQDAMRLARRINESLRQPIVIGDAVVVVSASVGVAIYPDDGTTAEELLVRADSALYRAKDLGRDRAVLSETFEPSS